MTTAEYLLWWSLAALGILGSALCSGAEMGCYSVNRVRLDLRAGDARPDRLARLLRREISRPDRLLPTVLIGNNGFHFLLSVATTALLTGAGHSDTAIATINTLVLTPIVFIFGETLPKVAFREHADRLTYAVAPWLKAMRLLFTATGIVPALGLLIRAVRRVLRLPAQDVLIDPRARIAYLLKEGASEGALSQTQSTLIDRALAFRKTTVSAEMVPWSRVVAYPASWDRARMLRMIAQSPHSRVPLTDPAGRVVGVLRQIDLYLNPDASPAQLAVPVARLSPATSVHEALRRLRASPSRVGIVEHHARPIGLVAVKDLVEPLTGELADW